MSPFHEGQIVQFRNPENGVLYDGVIWRVMPEDKTNYSLFIRYVDEIEVY